MKYLLTCAACKSEIPVTTGQAGQMLRCNCGQTIEVPSIRNLKHLPPAVEEPQAPIWTRQKGFLFLGTALAACSLAFAAAILMYRPSSAYATEPIVVDPAAIQREVDSLSLPQSIGRLLTVEPGSQRTADQLPAVYLQLSKHPIQEFEREAYQPLTPTSFQAVLQQAIQRRTVVLDNRKIRANLNRWLIFAGGGIAVGALIACAAAMVPKSSPPPIRARS